MKPTVGAIVHYQSYGTPGGEYLPEPRAAIITAASGPTDPPSADEPPENFAVGLCVLNPTGLFFKEEIPFAANPTPGTGTGRQMSMLTARFRRWWS